MPLEVCAVDVEPVVAFRAAEVQPGAVEPDRDRQDQHALVEADARPGVIEIDAPVHAHQVAARLGHQFEQARIAGAEVDRRCTRLRNAR